jgi:hypothetical protein
VAAWIVCFMFLVFVALEAINWLTLP